MRVFACRVQNLGLQDSQLASSRKRNLCGCCPASKTKLSSDEASLEVRDGHGVVDVPSYVLATIGGDGLEKKKNDDLKVEEVVKDGGLGDYEEEKTVLKGILKKNGGSGSNGGGSVGGGEKGRVQWTDFQGRDLVEVKEFEKSDLDNPDEYPFNPCGCIVQ